MCECNHMCLYAYLEWGAPVGALAVACAPGDRPKQHQRRETVKADEDELQAHAQTTDCWTSFGRHRGALPQPCMHARIFFRYLSSTFKPALISDCTSTARAGVQWHWGVGWSRA